MSEEIEMETEREFSFKSYFIYAVRKWIVPVLCVLIGVGAGVYYSLAYKTTNIIMCEGTLRFEVDEYRTLYYGQTQLGDGGYSICEAKGRSMIDVAATPKLKSQVYKKVKDEIYPDIKSETKKRNKFFSNLKITRDSNFSLRVDFAYNIVRDEDKGIAYRVVSTYLDEAQLDIRTANSGLYDKIAAAEAADVIHRSTIDENYDTAEFSGLTQSNSKPSLVTSSLIGGVGGLAVAVAIITILYLCDKRIKRLQYLVSEEDARVFSAGADPYADGSLVKLATAVTSEKPEALLIASIAPDEEAKKYAAAFAEALSATGKKSKLVEFGEGKEDWKKYFAADRTDDEFEIFSFDGSEKGALGFIAAKAGNACFVVNQATVRANDFAAAVDEVNAAGARYFGTVLYNVTDSYTG